MKSFLSKKSILRTMAVAAVCMLGATSVKAQEFTIQGDFVSSYVWRGIYQGNTHNDENERKTCQQNSQRYLIRGFLT